MNMKNATFNTDRDLSMIVRDGGAPTPSGSKKAPSFAFATTQLFNKQIPSRAPMPTRIFDGRLRALSTNCEESRSDIGIVRDVTSLPNTSWRNESYINETLEGNPFINNLIHISDGESIIKKD